MPGEHQHVTITPQPDKVAETRDLLDQVAELVKSKKAEGGPISWSASISEDGKQFFVDALFEDQKAIEFRQTNIAELFMKFFDLVAAPPQTIIGEVTATA